MCDIVVTVSYRQSAFVSLNITRWRLIWFRFSSLFLHLGSSPGSLICFDIKIEMHLFHCQAELNQIGEKNTSCKKKQDCISVVLIAVSCLTA